jgi:hypothetical protein
VDPVRQALTARRTSGKKAPGWTKQTTPQWLKDDQAA